MSRKKNGDVTNRKKGRNQHFDYSRAGSLAPYCRHCRDPGCQGENGCNEVPAKCQPRAPLTMSLAGLEIILEGVFKVQSQIHRQPLLWFKRAELPAETTRRSIPTQGRQTGSMIAVVVFLGRNI